MMLMMSLRTRTGRPALGAMAALALAAGCGGGGGGGTTAPPPSARTAFVVTTNFETGSFATVSLDDPLSTAVNLGQIHSDAVARFHDGRVYVLNRFGADSVQAIDPEAGFATVYQCSVGNGANPQDIAFVSPTKAYVTRYGTTSVAIVDPSVGADCEGFLRGEVDLSFLADGDGLPELWKTAIVGDRLYVAAQRLDRDNFFEPTGESFVAVVDTATDEVVDLDPTTPEPDAIRLSGANPFGETKGLTIDRDTGEILVAEAGSFSALDGGIERIDPAAGVAEGFFVREETLGGNVTDFVVVDAGRGYAVLSDLDFSTRLVRFDPTTGELVATLIRTSAFVPDIEYDATRDRLYVLTQDTTAPGLRVFAGPDDREITDAPIDTGLPPFNIVLLP